jgi:hypothetical protein
MMPDRFLLMPMSSFSVENKKPGAFSWQPGSQLKIYIAHSDKPNRTGEDGEHPVDSILLDDRLPNVSPVRETLSSSQSFRNDYQ